MSDLSASSSHMWSKDKRVFLNKTNAEYHNATANKETSFLHTANLLNATTTATNSPKSTFKTNIYTLQYKNNSQY